MSNNTNNIKAIHEANVAQINTIAAKLVTARRPEHLYLLEVQLGNCVDILKSTRQMVEAED